MLGWKEIREVKEKAIFDSNRGFLHRKLWQRSDLSFRDIQRNGISGDGFL